MYHQQYTLYRVQVQAAKALPHATSLRLLAAVWLLPALASTPPVPFRQLSIRKVARADDVAHELKPFVKGGVSLSTTQLSHLVRPPISSCIPDVMCAFLYTRDP